MKRLFSMKTFKYAFYFTMTCLAIINIVFFICNWYDLQLDLNKESVLLSVVGFFFAFAGINIYSIFNTNIENEKQSIRELKERYDNQLKLSEKELQFPKELIKVYQTAQYLASTETLNINSFDWIRTIKNVMDEMRNFVKHFKECENDYKFEMYRTDLVNLSQGVLVLLKHHKSIIGEGSFFNSSIAEKDNYTNKLDELIGFVEETRTYSYEQQVANEQGDTWICKIRRVIKYAKVVFDKKGTK